MRQKTLALVVSAVLAGGAACDKSNITDPLPLTPAPTTSGVISVIISPASSTLVVGQSEVLASVVSATGTVDRTVTWSSNDTSIATVDDTGKVNAIKAGTTTIIATSKGDPNVKGAATVIVQAAGVDLTQLYGTFNISATKTTDTGCNFNNSFGGQVTLSGTNKDGTALTIKMIEQLTRIYTGSMSANGSFSGTGSGNLNGFIYTGMISGSVTGNNLTGTESLNFTAGCPGKSVIYQFTGSK